MTNSLTDYVQFCNADYQYSWRPIRWETVQ